ncbi:rod shape-determining protein MreD [Catenovulum sp. 2E275]|uniref:rod shape-determining protein MreD n=1 Tax=Catenovulum sp. 2E275 TaxID=2980497 RepID=UPI0021D22363|nr:rod shape-determining protein MreD [Catenovulum sp. 2E275]MCU4676582.1 rod shape-determining protein MreD [Catenovulum sp. 2E275]
MRGFFLIGLTLLFALTLAITPMPSIIESYRPDWILLVLVYWCIALPHRVNVGTAWFCGFLLDILLGSVLGTHAFMLAFVAYICSANYLTIRNFSSWQQSLIIALVTAFYHLVDYWLQHFLTTAYFMPELLWPVLSNAFVWTFVFYGLRKYRRTFRIR